LKIYQNLSVNFGQSASSSVCIDDPRTVISIKSVVCTFLDQLGSKFKVPGRGPRGRSSAEMRAIRRDGSPRDYVGADAVFRDLCRTATVVLGLVHHATDVNYRRLRSVLFRMSAPPHATPTADR